jgi:hypothetical protein
VEQLESGERKRWERRKDTLPPKDDDSDEAKAIRNVFKTPEKDGDELSVEDVLWNNAEYDKLKSVGVFKGDDDQTTPPVTSRPGEKDKTDRKEGKSRGERMEGLYVNQDGKAAKGAQENR